MDSPDRSPSATILSPANLRRSTYHTSCRMPEITADANSSRGGLAALACHHGLEHLRKDLRDGPEVLLSNLNSRSCEKRDRSFSNSRPKGLVLVFGVEALATWSVALLFWRISPLREVTSKETTL